MISGDIRKLPKANSPMWTEQWAYQGSAKQPYIISSRRKAGNGQSSGWDVSWGCSCKSWTSTMPRQDCKHIVAVQKKEGLLVAVTAPSSMNPEMKKDFEKYLAQKQESMVHSGQIKKPNALEERGRKFRV